MYSITLAWCVCCFFFSSRRRHTRSDRDWSSDVCSSDLLTGKEVGINVEEIKRPELSAQLVADSVAHQLTQRISFRRAMKRAVQSAMRMGAQGIKIKTAGRLGGAEIARTEGYHE